MDNKTPLLYAKILFAVVIIAAAISILYKTILQIKNSNFKSDTFNLLYLGKSNSLIHIDGAERKILVYKIPKSANAYGKSLVAKSANLGVLVDGEILGGKQDVTSENFMDISLLFTYWGRGAKLRNVNNYDLLKIFFISKMIPNASRTSIDKPTIIAFSDPEILDEGLSVAVINASEIDGLGFRIATALKSAGINVVSVGSSSEESKSQIMTNSTESKTLAKLKSTLQVPVKKTDQKIADITIVLGEDLIN